MYFLLNDIILDVDPSRMMHPLEQDRFANLSADYIALLGKEMFAEDPHAHRSNPEMARRLAYLIHLKMPRVNAAEFFVSGHAGDPDVVETRFQSLNEIVVMAMFGEQKKGQLDAAKIDNAVWHRRAA